MIPERAFKRPIPTRGQSGIVASILLQSSSVNAAMALIAVYWGRGVVRREHEKHPLVNLPERTTRQHSDSLDKVANQVDEVEVS
jgi:hypothetical protein